MSQPIPPDAWKTAAIREAESALDRSVSKSRQLLKDLEKIKLPPVERTVSPERLAAIKAAAARPDAPPQLKLLKRKVEAGQLTWEDVASGRAFADPEVQALALGPLGEAHEMYDELREGATADEVLEAREGGRPADPLADTGRSPYAAGPAPQGGYSADTPLRAAEPPADHPQGNPRWSAEPGQSDHPQANPRWAAEPPADHPQGNPRWSADPGRPDHPQTNPRWSADPSQPDHHRPAEPPADHHRPAEPPTPPSRHRAPEPELDDDDFADPLADDAPPPRPSSPEPPRRKRRDEPGSDDDYFGGSFLG
ncbi:hypothetical protein M8542_35545 [Amycolatopsis sp. OK19-0408]|uniref:Uncharacterized protein n=1 Tax=Amycolatopsis iheyensis TaxID=2945988 RepID=A0A9X2SPH6_9PSEU|nr:hypothetical protein [Amycolatopsis iheyensis]MCR6488156.1 hypothetical protein [Amycolatopsis iheyensis]